MTNYKKILYKEAAETSLRNKQFAKWPSRRSGDNRLEPEAWPQMRPSFRIQPGETIFTIGSCFARNIESYFFRLGFRIPTLEFKAPPNENPRNTLLNKYTPASIYSELEWTHRLKQSGGFNETAALEKLIALSESQYVDVNLVGFMPVSLARAIQRRREIYDLYLQAFTADVVTITLGLIEAWWDNVDQRYIEIAPTQELAARYPERFEFRVLSYEDSRDYICKSIELLNSGARCPKILLTTSPIPLQRTFTDQDVLIANTYSKSQLRAVAGYVADRFSNVDYFPSYEIVALSKAPGIFIDDLIHVSEQFIGRIVVRVYETYVDVPADEMLGSIVANARAACATGNLAPARNLAGMDSTQLPQRLRSAFYYLKARAMAGQIKAEALGKVLSEVSWEDLVGMELVYFGKMQIESRNAAAGISPLVAALNDGEIVAAHYLVNHCLDDAPDPPALARQVCDALVALPILLKNSLDYWLVLALAQRKNKNLGEAWKAARNAAAYAPNDKAIAALVKEMGATLEHSGVESAIVHAQEECWQGRLNPARELLRKYAPETIPEACLVTYSYLRARVLAEDGHLDQLPEALKAIPADSLDGLELLFLGKMQAESGNVIGAESTLRACLKRGIAVFISSQLLLSHCFGNAKNPDGLIQEMRDAMERFRNVETAAYWFTLALLQDKLGEFDAAKESARRAVQIEPHNDWYVGLAQSFGAV